MKTWLKAVWKFLIEPCVLAVALLVLAFMIGRLLGFVFSLGNRTKLTEVTTAGYVLADLYDRENIRLYPITDGAAYDIRGYTVEVSGQTVTVTKYFA